MCKTVVATAELLDLHRADKMAANWGMNWVEKKDLLKEFSMAASKAVMLVDPRAVAMVAVTVARTVVWMADEKAAVMVMWKAVM